MAEAATSECRYSDVRSSVKGKKKPWKEVTVGPRQFKIRGPLGKGGFSEVYAGEDSETGKRVALKMMFDVQDDETTYKQTCDEIKMMRKLNHPNLIKLLGYDLHAKYRDRKCVILVQELAPNRELFEYLLHSRSTFSEALVMYIGKQIFSAIQFMHDKGIAHRDLKPENILLDKEFQLKIADFGFAKFFRKNDQSIKMRTELGTRGYMAPEISSGSHIPRQKRQSYDEKVDIFALGVIMFICFAGFPPFRQTNNEDWWFDKIIKKEWAYFWKAHERKAKFSASSKKLLEKMLAAKAADRYDIKGCLGSDFIKSNPVGKIMDKTAYKDEMTERYKFVKKAIKKAKENKAAAGKRDLKSELQNQEVVDKLAQFKDYIPADVLCKNDIRLAIYNAPEETLLQECAKQLSQTINIPVREEKAYRDKAIEIMSEYESDGIRALFSNATEAENFGFLKEAGINFNSEKLFETLNKCIIGKDVAVPIDGDNSLAQYMKFDAGDNLDLYNPEEFEDTPTAFHVRFGLGTFIHLMRQFGTNLLDDNKRIEVIKNDKGKKTITLTKVGIDDFENGVATVTYDIVEQGETEGESFELKESLSIEVKLWQLLPKYKQKSGSKEGPKVVTDEAGNVELEVGEEEYEVVEVPGFALTVREMKSRDALNTCSLETKYIYDKLLNDSELLELCF